MNLKLLSSDVQKNELLSKLKDRRDFLLQKKYESSLFWHTCRIYQSLSLQVVSKTISVDDLNEPGIILSYFEKQEKTCYRNYEIWIDRQLVSLQAYNELVLYLVQLFKNLLDNKTYILLRSFPEDLVKDLERKFEEHLIGVGFNNVVKGFQIQSPIEESSYQVQEDEFQLMKMTNSGAKLISNTWKYGSESDDRWMQTSLEKVPTLRLWRPFDKEHVGHLLFMTTGTFGGLSIEEKFRGRGLSRWLVGVNTNWILERGMSALVEIEEDNKVSLKLFSGLGYRELCVSKYVALDNLGANVIRTRFDL